MKIEEVIQKLSRPFKCLTFCIGAKEDQSYRKVASFDMMYLHEFSTWVEIA